MFDLTGKTALESGAGQGGGLAFMRHRAMERAGGSVTT